MIGQRVIGEAPCDSYTRARTHDGLWNMEALGKPQIIAHIEKSLNYTVFDVKWMPSSAKLVVLGSHPRDTGALQVYELSGGELKLVVEVSYI